MKVDFIRHKDAVVNHLVGEGVYTHDDVTEVVGSIIDFFNTHLPCTHCGSMLVDKAFYKSKVHRGRRNRMPPCKECHAKIYRGK